MAIAGRYMYTVDNSYGGLRRIDLNSGDVKVLNPSLTGAVSAEETHVWLLRADQLFNVDPDSGAATLVGPIATFGHNPTALMSVGDYLYASLSADGGKYPMFVRITKSNAYEQLITTSGFTDITGISTDLSKLYLVDNLGGTGSVMTINEESVRPGSIHGATLQAGERLNPGEQLVSTNEKYRLVMQLDGNLVEYDGINAVWASGSYGQNRSIPRGASRRQLRRNRLCQQRFVVVQHRRNHRKRAINPRKPKCRRERTRQPTTSCVVVQHGDLI